MAETSAGTPTSSSEKHPAVKDKQCPFCHHPFTSSSLGRHLDLYIKPKNPKPPDNVHDVEEIRKLRGSITRRQARSSVKKDDSTTSSNKEATPTGDQPSPTIVKTYPPALNTEKGPIKTYLNQPNWQATGVINDLPPLSVDDQPGIVHRRALSKAGSVKEDLTRRQRVLEERDRGQAAELALKEVLENVKSANTRAYPPTPFDFNFFKLSFSQMYLRCLSPPPGLVSEPPLPSPMTWTLAPPETGDCEILRGYLQDKLHDWRRRRENLHFGNDGLQNGVNGHGNYDLQDQSLNHEESMYNEHLSKVFEKWKELSEEERYEQWHYECAKALAREREQHALTTRKLEQAEQENILLRSRLTQKNTTLEAKDVYQEQPALLPLSDKSLSYLPNPSSWDFDTLLAKWKSRIKSARSTQYPLPSTWNGYELDRQHRDTSRFAALQNAAQETLADEDLTKDHDLEDAPGEEEDDNSFEQEPDADMNNAAHGGKLKQGERDRRGSRRLMERAAALRGSEDGGEMDTEPS